MLSPARSQEKRQKRQHPSGLLVQGIEEETEWQGLSHIMHDRYNLMIRLRAVVLQFFCSSNKKIVTFFKLLMNKLSQNKRYCAWPDSVHFFM